MANNWFQFKEFKILQDQCGMKVSTDACIQGALAAEFLSEDPFFQYALDIGTGTGLLSLMVAQKNKGLNIDAIEIDPAAALQASCNFAQSKWAAHLNAYKSSLNHWTENSIMTGKFYDFIICNPPFFQHHLHAQEKQRNAARHNVSLSSEDLFIFVSSLLKPFGVFCILYPFTDWLILEKQANENGLYVQKIIKIQPKHFSDPNRVVAFFSQQKTSIPEEHSLIIYESEKKYTLAFRKLLGDYYLNL